ncbi:hypothetical protein DERP_008935 [Dermatophagoides pteronyssinus]|uniref:Uncharacterized protein n=1 Tax=Dermatophagoides pteronyssinus TaxID=6956 RepID=A0ABQ8JNA1_DERPT|nr:hypothetical protein DERP_008935 [Dermatophagoides pteronyssinus]
MFLFLILHQAFSNSLYYDRSNWQQYSYIVRVQYSLIQYYHLAIYFPFEDEYFPFQNHSNNSIDHQIDSSLPLSFIVIII